MEQIKMPCAQGNDCLDADVGHSDELEQGQAVVLPQLGQLLPRGHLLTTQLQGDLKGL